MLEDMYGGTHGESFIRRFVETTKWCMWIFRLQSNASFLTFRSTITDAVFGWRF
jgi:hypothetical protein